MMKNRREFIIHGLTPVATLFRRSAAEEAAYGTQV